MQVEELIAVGTRVVFVSQNRLCEGYVVREYFDGDAVRVEIAAARGIWPKWDVPRRQVATWRAVS